MGNAATWYAARAGKLFLKTEKKNYLGLFCNCKTSQKLSSIDYYMYKVITIQDWIIPIQQELRKENQ